MKSVRITIFFSLLLIGAFLALAGRCFYLQFLKGDHYISACLKQQQGRFAQLPRRGVILDRRGRVLAASNRIQTIKAEPRIVKDAKSTSAKLSTIVDMGAHDICKLIVESKNLGYVKIKAGAEPNECDAARRISNAVGVESNWRRYYPMGRLAAHAVGFTSLDNRGLGGIELQYDQKLGGSGGQNIFLADVRRRPIRLISESWAVNRESNHEPQATNHESQDGAGIILTLDAAIQQFARDELVKQYESYQAASAVAIVAEPKTGAILALVSLPDFEPGRARSTDPDYFRNRAISDEFEPGSIIKPIVAAIALDAGVVNTNEKIFCENGNYHGRGFGRIGEYRQGFGDLTLREILIKSSNIGMAKIGQRFDRDKLYNGLKHFGFAKKVGLGLPGEADGLLWPVSKWTGYSVTRIPFGQEITVTAVQLVRAFCILANGGRVVRPYLVRAIVDARGAMLMARESEIEDRVSRLGYIVKPQVAKWIVTDALVGVVNEGTGKRAKLEKWQVFGKSGTANIAKSNERGYSESDYVASFVAGAPADDPAIVVLVSIYKPNKKLGKGYTGGVVASPVAAKIIEKTLNYLGVPPTYPASTASASNPLF